MEFYATLGAACQKRETLEQMFRAGMTGIRLNLSHTSLGQCRPLLESRFFPAARAAGVKVGLIRPITLWPFPKKALAKAADQVKCFLSVELSMGQMIEDIRLSTDCRRPVYLCNRTGGMIPSPDQVLQSIYDAQKGAM